MAAAAPAPQPTHSFGSYIEYLEALQSKWPEYEQLRSKATDSWNRGHPAAVFIRDILRNGSCSELREYSYPNLIEDPSMETTYAEDLRTALRTCTSDVRTRVVFVDTGGYRLRTSMMNIMGLELDIEPQFFNSMVHPGQLLSERHSAFVQIGDCWLKIFTDIPVDHNIISLCG